MDFIEGLLKSDGCDTIIVVINMFTKFGLFLALSHPFSTTQVAHLFMDQIFKLYRLPDVIVSDRNKYFTSHF